MKEYCHCCTHSWWHGRNVSEWTQN